MNKQKIKVIVFVIFIITLLLLLGINANGQSKIKEYTGVDTLNRGSWIPMRKKVNKFTIDQNYIIQETNGKCYIYKIIEKDLENNKYLTVIKNQEVIFEFTRIMCFMKINYMTITFME